MYNGRSLAAILKMMTHCVNPYKPIIFRVFLYLIFFTSYKRIYKTVYFKGRQNPNLFRYTFFMLYNVDLFILLYFLPDKRIYKAVCFKRL